MKHSTLLLEVPPMRSAIIITSICIILVPAQSFSAVDLSIGGNVWYNWWKPAWEKSPTLSRFLLINNAAQVTQITRMEKGSNFKVNPSFLAGPSLSLRFLKRWSISSVFVCGMFEARAKNPISFYGYTYFLDFPPPVYDQSFMYKDYHRKIFKWDSDTSVAFEPLRFLKIVAGFKAQGYSYKERLRYFQNIAFAYIWESESKVENFGPGLGIAFTIPVVDSLYVLFNLSSFVLWGKETIDYKNAYETLFLDIIYPYSSDGRFISYGGTSSLHFAYVIEKANLSIATGFRYQVLKYYQKFNDVTFHKYNGKLEHFYGVTLSMIYTFHLGKT